MRVTIALTWALLLGPAAIAAQEDVAFRWQGSVSAGQTIEVRGVHGDIEAGPSADGVARVVATKSARRSDPSSVRIEVEESAGRVIVCAIYPAESGARVDTCSDLERDHQNVRDNDVEVDFDIQVPAGARFVGKTVNGAVAARGLDADVRAYTVNGAIEVADASTVEAQTVNGAIHAVMSNARWEGTLSLRTVNGVIHLALPAGVQAQVSARTVNGSLASDFPLTISAGRRWGPRSLEGTIGSGGGSLELETVNGGIEIVRR